MSSESLIPRIVMDALVGTFCHEIIDSHGCLLLSTRQARNDGRTVIDDSVGYESTMNKRYVADLSRIDENETDTLMIVGRAIIQVWSERIALRFPGRSVVFYLGGSESVILRFHVRRAGQPDWTDLADREYLATSRIEVYVLVNGNLTRV